MTATVNVRRAVLADVREHVNSELQREVGGILVGRIAEGAAEVTAALPALAAVGHRANVTFTHEVWDELLPRVDAEFPGRRIVGWYHSHPGFGIFLSEYDTFIQRNFFSDPAMLALVVDPHTGEAGWFGWRNGDVELLERQSGPPAPGAPDRPGRPAGRPAPPGTRSRRPLLTTLAVGGVALATVAFALGYATAPTDIPAPASPPPTPAEPAAAQLDEAHAEIADLRERLETTERALAVAEEEADAAASASGDPAPTSVVYSVRRGDTLWGLAESLYGGGDAFRLIGAANPDLDARAIPVGEELRLPLEGMRAADDATADDAAADDAAADDRAAEP